MNEKNKIAFQFLFGIIIIIIVSFTIGILTTQISAFSPRKRCLNSQNPRRWNSEICEEYYNNEWVTIDLSRKADIYYNDMGQKIKE